MPSQLSAATLQAPLPYDRAGVTPGIVHLGVGAFHRAHQAVYLDDVLRTDPSWGIIGASLRRPDTRDALQAQDYLYTLIVRSREGTSTRIIGSLLDVLDASQQREALIAAMTDPRTRIVSLTVTEKGYCHNPATGQLDPTHPDIVHDLAHTEAPVSAPGLLVRALELRRERGHPPFTILSCDNLPANGETAHRIVTGFAMLRDPALGAFVETQVSCPSSMVDRIVPATTDADRELVATQTGLADSWPVVTEPFTQWVIEDRFPAGRPALEVVGAQMVADVKPYELMKLRLLNGSHSTLAYLGYLAGYQYVAEAIGDASFRALVHGLMTDEAMPTLPDGLGDLGSYRDALLARFANPALQHRTYQIAMDGSQKLPQRLLGTIRARLAMGRPVRRLALGVAGWMRYVMGNDEAGRTIEVQDPLAVRLRAITDAGGTSAERVVEGLLGVREVFGDDLPAHPGLHDVLVVHLRSLLSSGSKATVASLVGHQAQHLV
ncbi:MAG: mannitol dehydrogenase family protein [Devosia sp.]